MPVDPSYWVLYCYPYAPHSKQRVWDGLPQDTACFERGMKPTDEARAPSPKNLCVRFHSAAELAIIYVTITSATLGYDLPMRVLVAAPTLIDDGSTAFDLDSHVKVFLGQHYFVNEDDHWDQLLHALE